MTTVYHLTENELSSEFLKTVKSLFKNKKLTITIAEEIDETEYLLSNAANKKHLQKSITDLRSGKGKVFSIEELKLFAANK